MARKNRKKGSSKAKGAAKGAAAYYGLKKVFKGAFVVAGIAAVAKILRGGRTA